MTPGSGSFVRIRGNGSFGQSRLLSAKRAALCALRGAKSSNQVVLDSPDPGEEPGPASAGAGSGSSSRRIRLLRRRIRLFLSDSGGPRWE